jgi:hypothetical protein
MTKPTECTACETAKAKYAIEPDENYCTTCARKLAGLLVDQMMTELEEQRLTHLTELADLMRRAQSFRGDPRFSTVGAERVQVSQ